MYPSPIQHPSHIPWNKGKLSGKKRPLKLKEIWAIRIRLQLQERNRELALFNLAIDSKLRACDLMELTVADIAPGHGSSSGRLVGRFSLRLPIKPDSHWSIGWQKQIYDRPITYFPAEFVIHSIYRGGNMPGLWTAG